MAWVRGHRRHDADATKFVSALCLQFSARKLARLCGVSDRTVRRWRDGEDWPTADVLHQLIDRLFPPQRSRGEAPPYPTDMAIDGHTRVVGVGEYTIRSAKGVYYDDEN